MNKAKALQMDQQRVYRVTYKVYPNTKIKQVDWHGKLVYPLYVQLIYDRRNTVYKSNLFDLYLKPKYGIRVVGQLYPPQIEEVIAREEKLVEFIISQHEDDFSLELFKKEYDYYSRDLLDEMEPDFIYYLHTFFQDEGMPHVADALRRGAEDVHAGDIVLDLRRSLKPDLYGRLIEHSLLYTSYLPLFRFAEGNPKQVPVSMLLKDWETAAIRDKFKDYMRILYPSVDIIESFRLIEKVKNQAC